MNMNDNDNLTEENRKRKTVEDTEEGTEEEDTEEERYVDNTTEDERNLFKLSQKNDIDGLKLLLQHLKSSKILFNIDCVNEDGYTLLVDAVYRDDTPIDIISLLLQNGVDVNIQCEEAAAFYQDYKKNSYGVTQLVRCYPEDSFMDRIHFKRPLQIAYEYHRYDVMEILLESGADSNYQDFMSPCPSPLHTLFFYKPLYEPTNDNEYVDFIPHVRLLLEYGADVTLPERNGTTFFFQVVEYICKKNHGNEITDQQKNLLQLLLTSQPNVNIKLNQQYSEYSNSDYFEYRDEDIDADANSYADADEDTPADTPLHCAVSYQSQSVVRLLLNGGVDVNIQNAFGATPFFMVIVLLCKERLDVDGIPDSYLNTINILLESHANINVQWGIRYHESHRSLREGDTPLHCTLNYRCIPAQRLLLKVGADVNITNCFGLTPLFQAIYNACTNRSNRYKISDPEMKSIQLLLEAHSNINVQLILGSLPSIDDSLIEGETPLHCAVKSEMIDIVQLLLRYSPNLSIHNSNHETALDIARQKYNAAKYVVPANNDQKIRIDNIIKCLECFLRHQTYYYLYNHWARN